MASPSVNYTINTLVTIYYVFYSTNSVSVRHQLLGDHHSDVAATVPVTVLAFHAGGVEIALEMSSGDVE